MKMILLPVLVAFAALTSSCNTFIGLGRDMRIAGESMERTAEKASGGGGEADQGGAPIY